METETLDDYILDLLADEAARDAMEHMEESGFSDIEDAAHAMGCRITTTGLMEETLAKLPPEVMAMSWHRAAGTSGYQWVTAVINHDGKPWFYPYEEFSGSTPGLQEIQALDRWVKNRDLALPDGDCLTVSR